MKNIKVAFIIFMILPISLLSQKSESKRYKLWYNTPASSFEEALPLGNGRIGLMIYGGVERELININEETLWGGGPVNPNPTPDAPSFLPLVRHELFKENWNEASRILRNIQGPNSQSFVPMGDLVIEHKLPDIDILSDYYRELDIERAVALTSFRIDSVTYKREYFVSAPAQVAVVRLKASHPQMLSLTVNASTQFENASITSVGSNEFYLSGQLPFQINSDRRMPLIYTGENGEKGMRYQFRVKALVTGGSVTTSPHLKIDKADEVILLISAATSFNGFNKRPDIEGKDEALIATKYLRNAASIAYDKLKNDHISDYQSFFNRLNLNLGVSDGNILPTDQRLKNYSKGAIDPELEVLYFQFGRYLLISSSRPGGVPANLQGIWNINQRPSWGSNFTTNINLQMNYWPAEMLNMSELAEPLIRHIENLAVTGTHVARNFYNMNGWAVHHNSDIWAHANPVGHQRGDPRWANWALGSPWLSQHLYTHYKFTGDVDFLRERAYPLMKGAADFCKDWLVEKDGFLVTAPSTSPENTFIDEHGNRGVVTIASTMDTQIIRDLFTNLIEASEILNTDNDLRKEWKSILSRLKPHEIGKDGNLVEWYKDWRDADPQHRHVSHLFGLHPGRQISPLTTPELAKACQRTLEIRGDGGTGWSKAWKVNFHARLHNGNHAYKMFRELLSKSTLPNLFDTHPPFQIDGNFGGISGVGEMLLQSHLNEIHILPALPEAWNKGEIKGIRARGGFKVNMVWDGGRIKSGEIFSNLGGNCVLRTNVPIKVEKAKYNTRKNGNYYITTVESVAGKSFLIRGQQ